MQQQYDFYLFNRFDICNMSDIPQQQRQEEERELPNEVESESNWECSPEPTSKQQLIEGSQTLRIYEFQVSGKSPKYLNPSTGLIYKQYSTAEHCFYEYLSQLTTADDAFALIPFLPRYAGLQQECLPSTEASSTSSPAHRTAWLEHMVDRGKSDTGTHFLKLENMTAGYGLPNVIDLKLGVKKAKKSNAKFAGSTTNSHKFRINGEMVGLRTEEGFEQVFVSKYAGQKISEAEVGLYLALFFFDGQYILEEVIRKVIVDLRQLILSFRKFRGVRFISSSLFIAFDATDPTRFTVKLIDFDKYQTSNDEPDLVVAEGLVNVHYFLQQVLDNLGRLQEELRTRQLPVFHHHLHAPPVPQHVIEHYRQ